MKEEGRIDAKDRRGTLEGGDTRRQWERTKEKNVEKNVWGKDDNREKGG